eukprot:scaffold71095_cov23-Prasinocladus_malaysianus.AAC.1
MLHTAFASRLYPRTGSKNEGFSQAPTKEQCTGDGLPSPARPGRLPLLPPSQHARASPAADPWPGQSPEPPKPQE